MKYTDTFLDELDRRDEDKAKKIFKSVSLSLTKRYKKDIVK